MLAGWEVRLRVGLGTGHGWQYKQQLKQPWFAPDEVIGRELEASGQVGGCTALGGCVPEGKLGECGQCWGQQVSELWRVWSEVGQADGQERWGDSEGG